MSALANPTLERDITMNSGVRVTGLNKSFGKGAEKNLVLNDIDVDVASGEFVSIIGPSGCGKSTLLKIISGLLEFDDGDVSIGGTTVKEATRQKSIGLVPQAPALLPWRTVLDNVLLPMRVNKQSRRGEVSSGRRNVKSAQELLETFGLGDAIHKYPGQLSGGMQQRVAIARAFVFDPTVLLMDEPFSALDEMTRDRQRLELLDFWQSNQKTVVFVTHSVPEAIILSDRIVVLAAHPGRVHKVIDVNLPRPREEAAYATDTFRDKEAEVRGALREVMGDSSEQ